MTAPEYQYLSKRLLTARNALIKAKTEQVPGSITDRLLDLAYNACTEAGEFILTGRTIEKPEKT